LRDPGAFPAPPLSGKITWRVTQPEREPKSEEERAEAKRFAALSERIRIAAEKKRQHAGGKSPPAPEA